MWSDLAVVGATVACAPPYSFYFDLIEKVWKAKGTNNLPLHRLCTLARKQGAKTVVIEPAAKLPRVHDEITELDNMHAGGGGAAEAVAISFFACELNEGDDIADVDDADFLGQAIVINYRAPASTAFTISYVFEAVMPPPSLSRENGGAFLLNNYLAPHGSLPCEVKGRSFTVKGVYYCQQNSRTHVCAHACLRMAIKSSSPDEITPKQINDLLGVTPPCQGLSLGQIVQVIESRGLEADVTPVQGGTYMSLLASIIESGDLALLVFTTGNVEEEDAEAAEADAASSGGAIPEAVLSASLTDAVPRENDPAVPEDGSQAQEHVVLVFGHTRHSDEWHPQAIPVYAGPGSAKYLQASAWIDHFLIHDDNLGPYYTLGSQALERDLDVGARFIIAIRRRTPNLTATGAEAIAAVMLTNMLPQLATSASGRWFDYVTQQPWRHVLRTILISREDYAAHLQSARGHDDTAMTPDELARLAVLPERIWMVEFSLPSLFTGNRAKLGEVLLQADPVEPNDFEDVFVGLRLPNLLMLKDPESGAMEQSPSSLTAHSPMYRQTTCGVEW
ncbi:hypothetical protein [Phenylobacterium sp.]|uniref:hypothetical protein n=1 Tax=Phenylobacterium sp. TaxID=1871053 RepID=UPI002731E677|nr:hypothetical protein [Phenylobacterium sp.]MDP2214929.1 hypothetical protein [Phenylobacterium sp.]